MSTSYLLPQQKLVSKQRYGTKVTKRYDVPATRHQRALRQSTVRKWPVITMNAAFKESNRHSRSGRYCG